MDFYDPAMPTEEDTPRGSPAPVDSGEDEEDGLKKVDLTEVADTQKESDSEKSTKRVEEPADKAVDLDSDDDDIEIVSVQSPTRKYSSYSNETFKKRSPKNTAAEAERQSSNKAIPIAEIILPDEIPLPGAPTAVSMLDIPLPPTTSLAPNLPAKIIPPVRPWPKMSVTQPKPKSRPNPHALGFETPPRPSRKQPEPDGFRDSEKHVETIENIQEVPKNIPSAIIEVQRSTPEKDMEREDTPSPPPPMEVKPFQQSPASEVVREDTPPPPPPPPSEVDLAIQIPTASDVIREETPPPPPPPPPKVVIPIQKPTASHQVNINMAKDETVPGDDVQSKSTPAGETKPESAAEQILTPAQRLIMEARANQLQSATAPQGLASFPKLSFGIGKKGAFSLGMKKKSMGVKTSSSAKESPDSKISFHIKAMKRLVAYTDDSESQTEGEETAESDVNPSPVRPQGKASVTAAEPKPADDDNSKLDSKGAEQSKTKLIMYPIVSNSSQQKQLVEQAAKDIENKLNMSKNEERKRDLSADKELDQRDKDSHSKRHENRRERSRSHERRHGRRKSRSKSPSTRYPSSRSRRDFDSGRRRRSFDEDHHSRRRRSHSPESRPRSRKERSHSREAKQRSRAKQQDRSASPEAKRASHNKKSLSPDTHRRPSSREDMNQYNNTETKSKDAADELNVSNSFEVSVESKNDEEKLESKEQKGSSPQHIRKSRKDSLSPKSVKSSRRRSSVSPDAKTKSSVSHQRESQSPEVLKSRKDSKKRSSSPNQRPKSRGDSSERRQSRKDQSVRSVSPHERYRHSNAKSHSPGYKPRQRDERSHSPNKRAMSRSGRKDKSESPELRSRDDLAHQSPDRRKTSKQRHHKKSVSPGPRSKSKDEKFSPRQRIYDISNSPEPQYRPRDKKSKEKSNVESRNRKSISPHKMQKSKTLRKGSSSPEIDKMHEGSRRGHNIRSRSPDTQTRGDRRRSIPDESLDQRPRSRHSKSPRNRSSREEMDVGHVSSKSKNRSDGLDDDSMVYSNEAADRMLERKFEDHKSSQRRRKSFEDEEKLPQKRSYTTKEKKERIQQRLEAIKKAMQAKQKTPSSSSSSSDDGDASGSSSDSSSDDSESEPETKKPAKTFKSVSSSRPRPKVDDSEKFVQVSKKSRKMEDLDVKVTEKSSDPKRGGPDRSMSSKHDSKIQKEKEAVIPTIKNENKGMFADQSEKKDQVSVRDVDHLVQDSKKQKKNFIGDDLEMSDIMKKSHKSRDDLEVSTRGHLKQDETVDSRHKKFKEKERSVSPELHKSKKHERTLHVDESLKKEHKSKDSDFNPPKDEPKSTKLETEMKCNDIDIRMVSPPRPKKNLASMVNPSLSSKNIMFDLEDIPQPKPTVKTAETTVFNLSSIPTPSIPKVPKESKASDSVVEVPLPIQPKSSAVETAFSLESIPKPGEKYADLLSMLENNPEKQSKTDARQAGVASQDTKRNDGDGNERKLDTPSKHLVPEAEKLQQIEKVETNPIKCIIGKQVVSSIKPQPKSALTFSIPVKMSRLKPSVFDDDNDQDRLQQKPLLPFDMDPLPFQESFPTPVSTFVEPDTAETENITVVTGTMHNAEENINDSLEDGQIPDGNSPYQPKPIESIIPVIHAQVPTASLQDTIPQQFQHSHTQDVPFPAQDQSLSTADGEAHKPRSRSPSPRDHRARHRSPNDRQFYRRGDYGQRHRDDYRRDHRRGHRGYRSRRSRSRDRRSPSGSRRDRSYSKSPKRRSISPRKMSSSPRRRSKSPRRRSPSPRKRSPSPRRRKRSPSPRRRRRRRSSSPRRRTSYSPRQARRSPSPSRSRNRSRQRDFGTRNDNTPKRRNTDDRKSRDMSMSPGTPLQDESSNDSTTHVSSSVPTQSAVDSQNIARNFPIVQSAPVTSQAPPGPFHNVQDLAPSHVPASVPTPAHAGAIPPHMQPHYSPAMPAHIFQQVAAAAAEKLYSQQQYPATGEFPHPNQMPMPPNQMPPNQMPPGFHGQPLMHPGPPPFPPHPHMPDQHLHMADQHMPGQHFMHPNQMRHPHMAPHPPPMHMNQHGPPPPPLLGPPPMRHQHPPMPLLQPSEVPEAFNQQYDDDQGYFSKHPHPAPPPPRPPRQDKHDHHQGYIGTPSIPLPKDSHHEHHKQKHPDLLQIPLVDQPVERSSSNQKLDPLKSPPPPTSTVMKTPLLKFKLLGRQASESPSSPDLEGNKSGREHQPQKSGIRDPALQKAESRGSEVTVALATSTTATDVPLNGAVSTNQKTDLCEMKTAPTDSIIASCSTTTLTTSAAPMDSYEKTLKEGDNADDELKRTELPKELRRLVTDALFADNSIIAQPAESVAEETEAEARNRRRSRRIKTLETTKKQDNDERSRQLQEERQRKREEQEQKRQEKEKELEKSDAANTPVRGQHGQVMISFTPEVSIPLPARTAVVETDSSALTRSPSKHWKLKSRWSRACEMETSPSNETSMPTSTSDGQDVVMKQDETSAKVYEETGQEFKVPVLKTDSEEDSVVEQKEVKPPYFERIEDNMYLSDRKRSKGSKQIRRMICDCTTSREDRAMGMVACGEDCLNRMLMIECGSRCPCGEYCTNKRFERKQYSNAAPFQTHWKGWGLQANQDFEENQFVMEYLGEVLDYKQFKSRTKQYAKDNNAHYYFMALNADEIIDATYKGNISRFINHSCDPNCETQKWTVNGQLRVGFFTRHPITKGTELTFDYQFENYGEEAQKCFCGTDKCRGFLGGKKRSLKNLEKTPRRKASIEKRSQIFDDIFLEEEIQEMAARGEGLRNKKNVIQLARLMVRAESDEHRIALLKIIQSTKEYACLRLFLEYHGLSLMWSWMADAGPGSLEFKQQLLETLRILPITNKTILQDSKVLSVVQKWSTEIFTSEKESSGYDTPSETPSRSETPLSIVGKRRVSVDSTKSADTTLKEKLDESSQDETIPDHLEKIPSKKRFLQRLREIGDSGSDSEVSESSRVSGGRSDIESVSSSMLTSSMLGDSLTSSLMESSVFGDSLKPGASLSGGTPIGESEGTAGADETSAVVSKNETDLVDEGGVAVGDGTEVPPGEATTEGEDGPPVLEKMVESGQGDNAGQTSEETAIEEKPDAKQCNLNSLASELLESWSELKEVFRIPKKEQVEERKKTERELDTRDSESDKNRDKEYDRFGRKRSRDDSPESKNRKKDRKSRKSVDDDSDPSKPRKVLLPTPPKMSKQERRQLFEAQIKAKEELAKIQEQQEQELLREQEMMHEQSLLQEQQNMFQEAGFQPGTPGFNYFQGDQYQDPNTPVFMTPQFLHPSQQQFAEPSPFVEPQAPAQIVYQTPTPSTPQQTFQQPFPVQPAFSAPAHQYVPNTAVYYAQPSPQQGVVVQSPYTAAPQTSAAPQMIQITEQGLQSIQMQQIQQILQTAHAQSLPQLAQAQAEPAEVGDEPPPPPSPPRPKEVKMPPNWKMAKDAEGKIYYYHSTTRKTQWEPPTEEEVEAAEIEAEVAEHKKRRASSTTTAAADTSSEVAKRCKEAFRVKISTYIVTCLNPFRKPECKIGRINSTEDFKHLARKLTHAVLAKELKHCKHPEDLEVNENVKSKAKDYVKKYMHKFGKIYKKEDDSVNM